MRHILTCLFESYGGGEHFQEESACSSNKVTVRTDAFQGFKMGLNVNSKPSVRWPFQNLHLCFSLRHKKTKTKTNVLALTQKEGLDKYTYLLVCKLNGICPSLVNFVPAGHRRCIPLQSRQTISLVSKRHQL